MIVDTHAHYDDSRYDECDLSQLFSEMRLGGVEKIVTCAVNSDDFDRVFSLCEKHTGLYCAVGFYPHETHKFKWDKSALCTAAGHKKVVAIGEIGLDYYYDDSPRETQKLWVKNQIEVAASLALPITYHDRDAHADTLEILKHYRPSGVVHCFSGSSEMAQELHKIGMYIGIGGAVTFKNAKVLPKVVYDMPLEMMVLETDAPYMTPSPFRGKCNRSDYLSLVAEKIAEIKGVTVAEVEKVTSYNAEKIFKFGEK